MLVATVPPKPIPKGLFTALFLARLLVEKYVLGRPLERIVTALGADGLDVAKGTLVGTLKALCPPRPARSSDPCPQRLWGTPPRR